MIADDAIGSRIVPTAETSLTVPPMSCPHLSSQSIGVLMGFAIQFDNAKVNFDSFAYPNFVWLMRVLVFVATAVIPVVVILRALSLATEKRRL